MRTTECLVEALAELRSGPGRIADEEFWRVVERYRATLIIQAMTILGRQEDAEDVAQETLCKAFKALHQLRDVSRVGAWLRSINKRNALALYQRRVAAQEERLATGQLGEIPAPLPPKTGPFPTLARTAKEKILLAVDSLPEPFRDVISLRYWEKLSNEQIAERLSIPVGTVRSRLARADQMLSRKLNSLLRQEEHPK
jgi:RNA polymerase sigma-70 factor (ECF subfamily)